MSTGSSNSPAKKMKRVEEPRDLQHALDAELAGALRLHAIHRRLVTKISLAELASEILDAAIELSDADFCTFQVLRGDTLHIVAHRGFGAEFLDFFTEVKHDTTAVCGRALALRGRVIVEDVDSEPFFQNTAAREVLLRSGVRAVQSTPLFGQSGELYAMIATHFRSIRRPTERHLRYLDLLASQATSFLDRLRMEELRRETERLKTTAAMANSVAHEINNPLQALTNLLTLLETQQPQGSTAALLKTAEQQVQSIAASIQKLMAPAGD